MRRLVVLIVVLFYAVAAEAYIGPGAGVSFFGSLWAIVVGIVITLAAVLAWPVRWAWRRMRGRTQRETTKPDTDA